MIWDSIRYGFSPLYFVTIEGIPVVWSEKVTGKTLPTDYTVEDNSLSIDRSGAIGIEQIDRLNGTPATPPFAFTLLDTATVRDWMRKPSAVTTLTSALTPSSATANIVSSAGFSGHAYIGLEHLTHSGTTATSLTGLTRGVNGYPYAHPLGTSSQFVTDRPRYWRGRKVTLWAAPMDAAGYVTGNTLTADARQVWVGRLTAGPQRVTDGFTFEAEALDRVLDATLADAVTGKIETVGGLYPVNLGEHGVVSVWACNNAGNTIWDYSFKVAPYTGTSYTQGQLINGATERDLWRDAFNAALVSSGANARISAGYWLGEDDGAGGYYNFALEIPQDNNVNFFKCLITMDGMQLKWSFNTFTLPKTVLPSVNWYTRDSPMHPTLFGKPSGQSIVVKLDDPTVATVPPEGTIYLATSADGGEDWRAYQYASLANGRVYCWLESGIDQTVKNPIGTTVEIRSESQGYPWSQLILQTLESSGTSTLRGTYDTLPRGAGYSLSSGLIVESSFAPLSDTERGNSSPAGKSFAELYGGVLGFRRMAVVSKVQPSTGIVKLQLVSTDSPSVWMGETITDATMLAHNDDPVQAVQRLDAPNCVRVLLPYGQADTQDTIIAIDLPSVEAQGLREAEFTIPVEDRDGWVDKVKTAAAAWFAYDQTAQAAELTVPPWVRADVGDVVLLQGLTHPALWTWSGGAGAVGYTGSARVVGRTMDLVSLAVKLKVIFDGGIKTSGLSPSMQITAVTNPAAATSITVPGKYYAHLAATRAIQGGNYYLQHYRPGQTEAANQTHRVTAEALVGANCVLTVDNHSGGHTIVPNESRLTLPLLDAGLIVPYQEAFAHVNSGASWS